MALRFIWKRKCNKHPYLFWKLLRNIQNRMKVT